MGVGQSDSCSKVSKLRLGQLGGQCCRCRYVANNSAKGALMQELRLVAVSEDGSYAVLVVPGRSGRFALPIDERLRTVARGQFSRLAQYEIEVESPLRPKEIQDRIRAGETAEEIADAAGLPVDRIRRYEGPVLAEREFRATEAQRATVRGPGESGLAARLGEIVAERLADVGASAEDAEWDSRKRQDGNWQVQLAYTIAGRMRVAEWIYDPRGKHVTPDDDEAVRLSLDEAHWPGPRQPAAAAVTATVTPISSRASAASASAAVGPRHSDRRAEPERGAADRAAMLHPSRQPAPVTVTTAAASRPASADPPITPDRPTSAEPPAASQDGGATRTEQDEATQVQPGEADKSARPARRATGGRSRRSSVPSWDEIMFGNSRQPD
jgi:hypothetical protein